MTDEKSPPPRLSDIREGIQGFRETVAELDFEAYCGSWQERRAVGRGLEVYRLTEHTA